MSSKVVRSRASVDSRSGPARWLVLLVLGLLCWMLLASQAGFAAKEPGNRTYFTALLGVDDAYAISFDCLRFGRARLCGDDMPCMSWEGGELVDDQRGFSFDSTAAGLEIDGRARLDSRGAGSSIAGAGRIAAEGAELNFGFAGQAVKRRQCSRLLTALEAAPIDLEARSESLAAASRSGRAAPRGRTYFTVVVGFGERLDFGADCLAFGRRQLCPSGGVCGSWSRTDKAGGMEFAIADETGRTLNGYGVVEDRGEASTIAGAGFVENPLEAGNFAFAGRATTPKMCQELIAEIEGSWNNMACMQAAEFGRPAGSLYVLPYPVGSAYRLSQSYCDALGGHHARFAYDFAMPIGSPVVAARDGTVTAVEDGTADGDYTPGAANKVFVEHDDGSLAFYAHFQQGSISVDVGQRVVAGQGLGNGGDSGDTGGLPHIHFEVFATAERENANTVPVNFRNLRGKLDRRGGLIPGETYEALPE